MYEQELRALVADSRELLGSLKSQHESNQQQIGAYKDVIKDQKELMEKRILIVERQWSIFRNIMMTVFALVIIPMIIGGFTIQSDIAVIKSQDKADREEVLRAFGYVISETADALEDTGTVDVEKFESKAKDGVVESFGYVSRSVKPLEEE